MPRFRHNPESPGYTWAYRDLLTALLVVFVAMSALALIAVTRSPARDIPIQGNLVVALHWDARSNSDVDLWVKSPGDEAVGFERRTGTSCNLLRDDLGHLHDPSSENEEMTVCRNGPPGPYAVNVMAYDAYDGRFPIHASIEAFYSDGRASNRIFQRNATLTYQGQELTVARFDLTKTGTIVPGSFNDIPTRLYRAAP